MTLSAGRHTSRNRQLHQRYLIRYDALVGRPPAPRLLPCVQIVSSNMAETGNLSERETERGRGVLNQSCRQSRSSRWWKSALTSREKNKNHSSAVFPPGAAAT